MSVPFSGCHDDDSFRVEEAVPESVKAVDKKSAAGESISEIV